MSRSLTAVLLAVALAPAPGCLQYNDQCQPLVADPESTLGYLGEDVFLDRPYARHDNNALGQLAADAFRHAEDASKAPAELGIINGGSLRAEGLCVTRTSIPKGPLKNGLLHEVLLFENSVVTVNLTEQQLVAMFEHAAAGLYLEGQPILFPSGAFLHVSEGTSVRVDCSRPVGSRVVGLQVNARAVPLPARADASIVYRVAMPDFLLEGGDGYDTIFGDAATDLSRNPVTASTAEGKATDANLAEAHMRSNHSTENRALREAGRIIFENCARPARPVVP
ncbi:5'-nucleotidase-like protein [Archangium gephyra]|uniref:5'-nucleotidase n=1 Tax=Archangium gephyra TaxID=48 RepID=A0AAC8TFW0_9BACT|nr:5'-nucleotidase [Archangium gephyra]AKJ02986.1 5'-nucleotidase [Archangium gephyra]REG25109.1 5'-nucleotidase-like protein [Archangium gephyra]